MVISEETKRQLHQAIDLAEGYGSCKYVHEDKPMCVVAQFAHLSGTSVAEMKEWKQLGIRGVANKQALSPYLRGYIDVLADLQVNWDHGKPYYPEEVAREKMHRLVENYNGN